VIGRLFVLRPTLPIGLSLKVPVWEKKSMSHRSRANRPKAHAQGAPVQNQAQDQAPTFNTAKDSPLPGPKRQRRRAKADRGLPPDQELRQLAIEYLRLQRQHWPKLVKAGLLPDITDDVVAAMVEDFKHRHRTGQIDPAP
jgi:hypothetical protein